MYKKILKPILFLFDPECVHNMFTLFGELLGSNLLTRKIISFIYSYKGNDISKTIDGIKYKTPILLSAGFDYNGRLTQILPSTAFGGEEIGSVTARSSEGNKRPRLTRLKKSKSLLVNKGLKNEGVNKIITRLKNRKKIKDFVIGISIARTNDIQSSSSKEGIKDYCYSLKKLTENNIGDYYTLNISCPNAFGGETFTKPELLNLLLFEIKKIKCSKPIYIKMPINLKWEDFNELLKIIIKYNVNGVIIGNLNKNYDDLDFRNEAPQKYSGGLSGKPCKELSNNLIKKTKDTYGNELTIVGCGGTLSVKDVMEKLELGADIIHMITGMIFNGPIFMKKVCEEYAKKITEDKNI